MHLYTHVDIVWMINMFYKSKVNINKNTLKINCYNFGKYLVQDLLHPTSNSSKNSIGFFKECAEFDCF